MVRGAASWGYYSLWPHLRPRGYIGRLAAAVREREGREWETPEAVWHRQKSRLNALFDSATRHVPYYRRLAREGRMPLRIECPEDWAAMPVLTKDIIRREGDALLADNFPRDQMHRNATGGSSGSPLHFWNDQTAVFMGNVGEAWATSVVGLKASDSIASLWGAARFEPDMGKDFGDAMKHLITNRLVIDCFRMSEADLADAHRRLSRFQPAGLLGYASALVELASFLQRHGFRPTYPRKAIISAAETLGDAARQTLETVFGVPVFDRYGSREIGLIAVECDRHAGLHVDCENVFVELDDDSGVPGMQRIIITRLNQFSMPFLRYDIEDLAEGPLAPCPCGRGYPVLRKILGRVTEILRKPDGGCLPGELFPHLLKDCGIASYRVVQNGDYSLDIALVRTPDQTPEQDTRLRRVIADHVGPSVAVVFRYVDSIDRSATGKLLPVISRAPKRVARPG
jgi:phenylacetate-CoA ligase